MREPVVPKDETSRADELSALGWVPEDVRRYAELWEYRQRWGAINLEPEDRAFLRKAEAVLPKLAHGKAAQKKTLQEKSYYRWLRLHLDAMLASPAEQQLAEGEAGAWRVLLEEELAVLDQRQPVLGLPDTLKARELQPLREDWIGQLEPGTTRPLEFDFQGPIEELKQRERTSWKPLRGEENSDRSYPVLSGEPLEAFRSRVREELDRQISGTFPSLKDAA